MFYIFEFQALTSYLEGKGLTFKKFLETHQNFEKAMDLLRERIYEEVLLMHRYRFDSDLFGDVEHWSGPWISFFLKVNGVRYMDCEDSSLLFMSLMKAAGVPRGFQRAVAGMTKLGGHCTVYVYNFEQEEWKHFETTASSSKIFSSKNKSESIAIYDTWFSFDWKYAWSKEPAETVTDYERTVK